MFKRKNPRMKRWLHRRFQPIYLTHLTEIAGQFTANQHPKAQHTLACWTARYEYRGHAVDFVSNHGAILDPVHAFPNIMNRLQATLIALHFCLLQPHHQFGC